MLLAESTIEHFGAISPEFPQQVDAMLARLDAAQQNKPTPLVAGAPLLDEMARRAQERLLLAQVAREIQANLRHMEQVLDAFFRDNSKRAELATLASDSRQIAGALKMLGLDSAERLLELCQQQIDDVCEAGCRGHDDDLEMLAESLSGLGFYIEAVEQQRPDRERLIAPLLDRRLGVAPKRTGRRARDRRIGCRRAAIGAAGNLCRCIRAHPATWRRGTGCRPISTTLQARRRVDRRRATCSRTPMRR